MHGYSRLAALSVVSPFQAVAQASFDGFAIPRAPVAQILARSDVGQHVLSLATR